MSAIDLAVGQLERSGFADLQQLRVKVRRLRLVQDSLLEQLSRMAGAS